MLTDDLTISSALADLAALTGDQPLPLAAIEDRARGMRRGRRAGRAGVVVICVATLATGIGLAGSGGRKSSELTAFGAAPVVLPLCTADPAQRTPPPPAKAASADDVKRGAAAGAAAAPAVGEMFKALGTVTGKPTADAVTILVAAPISAAARPVIFGITRDTQFFVGNQPSAARILRAGQQVGFLATKTGPAGYRLDAIDTDPGSVAGSSAGRPAGGSGAGTALPAVGQAVDGKGFLAAAPVARSTTVSLTVAGGPLAGTTLRLAVTPATRFISSGRQCDPSGLPAGTRALFAATRTGSTTYRLDRLDLT